MRGRDRFQVMLSALDAMPDVVTWRVVRLFLKRFKLPPVPENFHTAVIESEEGDLSLGIFKSDLYDFAVISARTHSRNVQFSVGRPRPARSRICKLSNGKCSYNLRSIKAWFRKIGGVLRQLYRRDIGKSLRAFRRGLST